MFLFSRRLQSTFTLRKSTCLQCKFTNFKISEVERLSDTVVQNTRAAAIFPELFQLQNTGKRVNKPQKKYGILNSIQRELNTSLKQ